MKNITKLIKFFVTNVETATLPQEMVDCLSPHLAQNNEKWRAFAITTTSFPKKRLQYHSDVLKNASFHLPRVLMEA